MQEYEKLRNILGAGRKLPGDLGNAAARGRRPSPQNQGGFEKKRQLDVKTKVLSPGGGGGAPLWKADEGQGAWPLQGHQAHLQRPKHNPGKIIFFFLVALKRK